MNDLLYRWPQPLKLALFQSMRNWTVLFWKLHDSYYDPHEPMYSKKQGVGDKAPAGSRRPDCVLARREARQVEYLTTLISTAVVRSQKNSHVTGGLLTQQVSHFFTM